MEPISSGPITGSTALAPFPALPDGLAQTHGLGELWLRPFAVVPDDLTIDFSALAAPELATAIIAGCTLGSDGARVQGEPASQFFWDLPLGTRIECLLVIVGLDGGDRFSLPLHCSNAACGEALEIDFTLGELLGSVDQTDQDNIEVLRNGKRIALRRPTATDQVAWRARSYDSRHEAVRGIAASLIVEQPDQDLEQDLEDEWLEIIEQTLDRHDPLVDFAVTVQCPECREHNPHRIDLADFALGRLAASQARVFQEVHLLAGHYHWSEPEILAIPPWRRAKYLALLEREALGR
jgi:hypothetical protein